MRALQYIADNRKSSSPAARLRRRRFRFFRTLSDALPRPLSILDVGGTEGFWRSMEFADEQGVEITLLNNQPEELRGIAEGAGRTIFHRTAGDGRAMPQFSDKQFDIVFSNSVLEHVGGPEEQRRMLDEAKRVGRRWFIQTPNYYFPIEPHFLVPGFQFLPVRWRALLLQRFNLGWTPRVTDPAAAAAVVSEVRLLTRRELKKLCPDCAIYRERILGLTKSFVLYGGW